MEMDPWLHVMCVPAGKQILESGANVYKNAFEDVTLPPGVVTITSAEPATRGGAVQMILFKVAETFVAFTPPKVTDVAPVIKLVPDIVTLVPPNVEPEPGEIFVIVGGGGVCIHIY